MLSYASFLRLAGSASDRRMGKHPLNLLGWVIGPTIWMSSLILFIHGLWTSAWYSYAFGAVFLVAAGSWVIAFYRIHRSEKAEVERMLSEWQVIEGTDE